MRNYISGLILCMLIFAGCEQNITLELPKYDPKVAVFCILKPQYEPRMYLNLSKSFYDYGDTTHSYGFVKNAQVYILDQTTNQRDTLHLDSTIQGGGFQGSTKTWFYEGKHPSQIGHHYIAEIHYNNKIITAETTVPQLVNYAHYDYTTFVDSFAPEPYYEIHLYINDKANEVNYYSAMPDWVGVHPGNQYDETYDFTSDQGLDGKEVELIVSTTRPTGVPPGTSYFQYVTIDNVSKELAVYMNDLRNQASSGQSPFSQPVTLESNVNGGLGVFGSITSNQVTVKIK